MKQKGAGCPRLPASLVWVSASHCCWLGCFKSFPDVQCWDDGVLGAGTRRGFEMTLACRCEEGRPPQMETVLDGWHRWHRGTWARLTFRCGTSYSCSSGWRPHSPWALRLSGVSWKATRAQLSSWGGFLPCMCPFLLVPCCRLSWSEGTTEIQKLLPNSSPCQCEI